MGIPIRLAVGPYGDETIDLQAVTMDIAVDRNVSAFPTPNNILNRMAIDTNIPSVEIEISGILEDDDVVPDTTTVIQQEASVLMNFASVMPTSLGIPLNATDWGDTHITFELDPAVYYAHGIPISTNTKVLTIVGFGLYGNEEDMTAELLGMKLFNQYGKEIGTITAITVDDDFIDEDQCIGPAITHITLNQVSVAIGRNETLHAGTTGFVEDMYIDKAFAIYPDYWRMRDNDPNGAPNAAIRMKFTSSTSARAGGSTVPTVSAGAIWYPDANHPAGGRPKHALIHIPIGGVFTAASNGNPAATIALLVKDALDIASGAVYLSHEAYNVHPDGGRYPTHAFSSLASGPLLLITQKFDITQFHGSDYSGSTVFSSSAYFSVPPFCSEFFNSSGEISWGSYTAFHPIAESAQWEIITRNSDTVSTFGRQKSAGDKVQDLLGLISNANKSTDLIRGIQIPYDSLITSSAVTPMARNFFLTFGEQNIDFKGSLYNDRSASLAMVPSVASQEVGGTHIESKQGWLSKALAGIGADTASSLVDFIGNAISDTMVGLTSSPHGNDGGIRIIPEKLHVRYDAGHKYYAFNLKLLASDFVIGV